MPRIYYQGLELGGWLSMVLRDWMGKLLAAVRHEEHMDELHTKTVPRNIEVDVPKTDWYPLPWSLRNRW